MRAAHLTLILAGAAVAAGGVYLVLELRSGSSSAAPTVGAAPSQAQGRAAQDRRPAASPSRGDERAASAGHGASPLPRRAGPTGHAGQVGSTGTDESGAEAGSDSPAPFTIPRIAATNRPIIALRETASPERRHPASLGADDRHAGDASLTSLEDALARSDFAAARTEGMRILERNPAANPRALQIVVEASCGLGEAETAAKLASKLTPGDHAAVQARCAGHGVTLP